MRRLFVIGFGALLASACDPLPPTGNLVVQFAGLPAGAVGVVRITNLPGSSVLFSETVSAAKTLVLNPGSYLVRIDTVHASGLYAGPVYLDTITIARGKSTPLGAVYHLASGSITITANGFPAGQTAQVTLLGATGTVQVVSAPGTVTELLPGVYTLSADTVPTIAGDLYTPDVRTQQITVTASPIPGSATLNYSLASATLNVNVTGLTTTEPGVTVLGPNNFKRTTPATTSFHGLKAGTYTVSAPNINATCPNIYTASNAPQPLVQNRSIGPTATDQVDVAYSQIAAPPAWLNFKLENAYLTQVTQNWAGTVPMLSGRAALLRVFVTANQCNTAQPKVRVTLGSGLVLDTAGMESSVRSTVAEGTLLSSWNFVVPASEVKAGLTFTATVDPTNAFAESDETDNVFPASGSKAVTIRTAPVVGLRLIPIAQGGLTEVITSDTAALLMDWPKRVHPVGTFDVDIHDTYTTSRPTLQSQDQNGSWSGVLSELAGLKAAEGSARFYYGVVKVNYTSGVAGLGYIPGTSQSQFRAALGWSYTSQTMSSNSASYVMAHEMGHNFGRFHTPCGNPAGVDQLYPGTGFYQGGFIGAFGYDATDGSLKAPDTYADIMGYCNPRWISDYTYVGMMDNLTLGAASLPMTENVAAEPGLLVWGRIVNGEPILEPAFEVTARSVIPRSGPYRVAAMDDNGTQLFAYSFAGERIADLPYEAETFAFVIPKSALRGRALGQLRLTARGRTAVSARSIDVAADPGAQFSRSGPRAVRMQWDATRFPVVMVRDPRNGQVLSFARGGDASIVTASDSLDVNFSNRVGSARRVIRAR